MHRWNLIGGFVRNNPFGTEIAFRKGLERLGEKVTIVDPQRHETNQKLDESADFTVIFKWLDNSPLRETIKDLGGKKIIYQVDDLRFQHIKQMMVDMRDTCSAAFTFDRGGADLARQFGYGFSRNLLLTADNNLYRKIPNMQKDIDVCFVGSMSNGSNHASRMKMVEIVKKMGLRFVCVSDIFDIGKINEIYNRSKIVLNHATDVGQGFGSGYGYQCRHFEAGFAGSFVLSNCVDDDIIKNIAFFNDEENLVKNIRFWLSENKLRNAKADALYDELYASHLPEHRASQLIEFCKDIQ